MFNFLRRPVAKKYMKGIQRQWAGYRANWMPGKPLHIGAIGRLNGGVFDAYYRPEDLGMKLQVDERKTDDSIDYVSSKSTSIKIKAAGEVGVPMPGLNADDAGFEVKFGGRDSIIFKTKELTYKVVQNKGAIAQRVLELMQEGRWMDDYCIVTEVVEAVSGTFIISKSKNSSLTVRAKGSLANENLDLASADLNFEVTSQKDIATKIIGSSGMTPLYKVMRVDKNGMMRLRNKEINAEELFKEALFEDADFDRL